MGLVSIGPVAIAHGDPTFSWSSSPTAHGIRSCTIGGSCSWNAATELSELIANPATRVTIGGRTGVQEWIEFDDDLLEAFTGVYLLEGFAVNAGQQHSLSPDDVPFSLAAAYLGDIA